MSDWQPIETCPDRPMPVLLFFANAHVLLGDVWVPIQDNLEPFREGRMDVGFWDGSTWCDSGSGHDLLEDWRYPDWTPTHWMPLPHPPEDAR